MFKVKLQTQDEGTAEFLHKNAPSSVVSDSVFGFSNREKAIEWIARSIAYQIRKSAIRSIKNEVDLEDGIIESFFPKQNVVNSFILIQEKLAEFLIETEGFQELKETEINIDGFIRFRLGKLIMETKETAKMAAQIAQYEAQK